MCLPAESRIKKGRTHGYNLGSVNTYAIAALEFQKAPG